MARNLISADNQLTGLANALGVSPQMLKNWDRRGPSEGGLNQVQKRLGINSTWVKTGQGQQFIDGNAVAPLSTNARDVELGDAVSSAAPQASQTLRLSDRALSLAERFDQLSPARREKTYRLLDVTLMTMEEEDSSETTRARSRRA